MGEETKTIAIQGNRIQGTGRAEWKIRPKYDVALIFLHHVDKNPRTQPFYQGRHIAESIYMM